MDSLINISLAFNSIVTWSLIAAFIGYVWWADRHANTNQSQDSGRVPFGSHHGLTGK